MREQTDNCATCANKPITADLIIKNFISEADMALFEESLHELFVVFVEKNELMGGDYKDNIILTYTVLRNLIKDVDKLKTLKA